MFGLNDPFGFDNHFNSMLSNFMQDPFGPRRGAGGNNNNRSNNNNNQLSLRQNDPFALSPFNNMHGSLMAHHRNAMRDPFALMNQMMGGFGSNPFAAFENINSNDPNTQVYTSSSVITYSNSGDGKPKIYQASSQTRQAGDVKETRNMVRDSTRGIEKVAVGHHIGDRAHVIERQRTNGGHIEEMVNLENLDDEEVNEFNREFENKLGHYRSGHHGHHHGSHHRSHHLSNNQPFAIEDGSRHKKDRKSKSKSRH